MKKRLPTIILFLIFFIGLAVMLYPSFSNHWNQRHASRAIAQYNEAMELLDEEDYTPMWEAAEAFNTQIRQIGKLHEMTEEETETYYSLLDPTGNDMMGYLSIEKIDVYLPIYHSVDENVLQIAIGHIPSSSMPTGGKGNHVALSGHRGLPSATLLSDLDRMKEGDLFVLSVMDRMMTYEVDQIKIVLPEEVDDLRIDPEQDYCTLVTCTPYGVNSHRLLVRGHRMENVAGVARYRISSGATLVDTVFVATAIAIPVLVVLLIVMLVKTSKKKTTDKDEAGTKG